MDVHTCLAIAQKDASFLLWKKAHLQSFLSYFFYDAGIGQIGFYDADAKKVFSLKFDARLHVLSAWEDELFHDPEKQVHGLVLDTVTIPLHDIIKKAESYFAEKYKGFQVIRKLYVLENTVAFGIIWNITFVAPSLQLIILKVNPSSGKVLDEQKSQLIGNA